MIYVYAISHPVTKQRQYIGISKNPKRRLTGHIGNSHNLKLRKWLWDLTAEGLTPVLEILEEADNYAGARIAESKWMTRCRKKNSRLFNIYGYNPVSLKPKTVTVTLTSLPRNVHGKIEVLAAKCGVSVEEYITNLVAKNVEESVNLLAKKAKAAK